MLPTEFQGQDSLEEGEQVSSHSSSEHVKVKSAGRKLLCQVCHNAISKYTCPLCEQKTCGIVCLNRHKIIRKCKGMSDPTDPVPRHEIKEKQVRKDFTYIKQVIQAADKVQKGLAGVNDFTQEPKRFKILRRNAKTLHNIQVMNAPPIIQRHRQNISFFYMKTKEIYWVLELLYFVGSAKFQYDRFLTEPLVDSLAVGSMLPQDYLSEELLGQGINTQKLEDLRIFLSRKTQDKGHEVKKKTIGTKKQEEAVELNKDESLQSQMQNICIYEFPTLYVVHKNLVKAFSEVITILDLKND